MSEVAEKIRKIFGIYISEKANEYTLNGLQNLKKEVLDAVESMEQQITDLENRLEAQNAVMFDVAKKRKKLEQRLSEIRGHSEKFPDLAEAKYVEMMKFYKLEEAKKLIKKIVPRDEDKVRVVYLQDVRTWFEIHKKLLDRGEQL